MRLDRDNFKFKNVAFLVHQLSGSLILLASVLTTVSSPPQLGYLIVSSRIVGSEAFEVYRLLQTYVESKRG